MHGFGVFHDIFLWYWIKVILEHGFHCPMVFFHGIGDISSYKRGKGKWKRHSYNYGFVCYVRKALAS